MTDTPTITLPKVTYWRNTKTGRFFWENNNWPAEWDFCEPATEEEWEKQSQADFRKQQHNNPPNRDLLEHPTRNHVGIISIGFDDRYIHGYAAFITYKIRVFGEWLSQLNFIPLPIEDIASIAIHLTEDHHFTFTILYSSDGTQNVLVFRAVNDD